MKNVNILILGLVFTFILFACKEQNKSEKTDDKMENIAVEGAEYTSAYVCPMHCKGSGSQSEGTCPVCGMDYVALADHKSDGHHHDEEPHDGHDHHNH